MGKPPKKSQNLSEWYTTVLIDSKFVDYSSVSGCIVLRPDSYFVWESIVKATDEMFKEIGVTNTSFPLLIPERLLAKEAKHIEHFSVEAAWVTHGGQSKLEERLAVRPTSETIMYDSVSKWVRSWRDLPMKLNQWNNVVRWEFKHPTPFLRTREFLWNEGHSIFASEEEAYKEKEQILDIYEKICVDYLALPAVVGKKTESEKFAGGVASYSMEFLVPDGKAIQGPDWHYDGQNFAKSFDIMFLDKDEQKKYAYQSTYAISTRMLGVMVMMHGDDKGLVLPPKLARVQVVVVPIYNDGNAKKVLEKAAEIESAIKKSFRTLIDDNDSTSPGWKFNEWELRGVPVRLEIGEKDIAAGNVMLVRRDTGEKKPVKMEDASKEIGVMLKEIHKNLYEKAKKFLQENTNRAKDYAELKKIVEGKGGFVQAPWCGSEECETKVKEETTAKITNMPLDVQAEAKGKKCVYCGKPAQHIANFAKSY
jgi:prolyl-tRNA synthetase